MPKLAEQRYENYYYESPNNINNVCYINRYAHQKTHAKSKRKKNYLGFLTGCVFIAFTVFSVMPFSFNKITKAIFNPTPYKHIQIDMEKLAFPTHDYLSNAWFMGSRDFRMEAKGKKAQMLPLKEEVNMPLLQSQLNDLAKLYPTVTPSVYVWDYETQNYVDINASKSFAAASIIKIPVLIDLFKSIEAGQLTLEEKLPLTEYYRTEGSGNLQFKAQNSMYTIDELARRMITDSDNSATNMIMAKIGSMTDVNQAIRNWGLKNTELQTWLPDLKGTNRITAREMAQMLYNIDDNDKFLTDTSRNKIFEYMGNVKNNRLIEAGLGQGAKFYHKTGDIGTMLGDAGIVTTPTGKKYIVVILANRPHNAIAGKDYIVHASEIIYNYMVK